METDKPYARIGALLLLCGLVLLALLYRSFHLGADAPDWYLSEDQGYHIDDGYKTFSAKNLALFDKEIWNESDRYGGWLGASPLTQYPYLYAYENFGVDLNHARAITIGYFAIFLVLTAVFLGARYGYAAALIGVVLLGIDPGLFHFSRTTLFETALIAFIYAGIFGAALLAHRTILGFLAILAATGVFCALFLKASGLLYVIPPLGVLAAVYILQRLRLSLITFAVMGALGVAVLAVLYVYRSTWMPRMDLYGTLSAPQFLLFNPISEISPVVFPMGLLALLAALRHAPRRLVQDFYAMSLAAILVGVPVLLASMFNNPPRYHVPVLPAAILLVLHWLFHFRALPRETNPPQPWLALSLAVQVLLTAMLAISIYLTFESHIGDAAHWGRHLEKSGLLNWMALAAVVLATILVLCMRRANWYALGPKAFALVAGAHVTVGLLLTVPVHVDPNYQGRAIAAKLRDAVAPEQSVAGDWAPYLTASTSIRSMWLHPHPYGNRNHPCRVQQIRADFFLAASHHDVRSLDYLHTNPFVSLGDPVPLGDFYLQQVLLYPLSYAEVPATAPDRSVIESCLDSQNST